MAVEDVQYFLFHFTRGEQIGPGFLLSLPREKSQVVPMLAQDRFGLVLDFRKQSFPSAHALIIHKNSGWTSCKPGSAALLKVKGMPDLEASRRGCARLQRSPQDWTQ